MTSPLAVFIADDSAPVAEVLQELIADPGRIEVVGVADTHQQAIADIQRLKPDVVVLDLQLRNGSGTSRSTSCSMSGTSGLSTPASTSSSVVSRGIQRSTLRHTW